MCGGGKTPSVSVQVESAESLAIWARPVIMGAKDVSPGVMETTASLPGMWDDLVREVWNSRDKLPPPPRFVHEKHIQTYRARAYYRELSLYGADYHQCRYNA